MLEMKKILIVFGTRPEAIKMAPVIKLFAQHKESFELKVCITAQHRQMLDQILTFFEIVPDIDLDLMVSGQTLGNLSAAILTATTEVLKEYQPDYVFVHGDTTTSTMVSLAAFYMRIKICHVEAGLRTYNKQAPFPEEINRQITARLADIHFAPTTKAAQNLLADGIEHSTIEVTGNTVIDALYYTKQRLLSNYHDESITNLKKIIDTTKKLILVTAHRRENFGGGFVSICIALQKLAIEDGVQIIYPVHLNPNVQEPVLRILQNTENIVLIEPLAYPAFTWLLMQAYIVITDSGGVQEEAPSFGKPVLVMRDTTERPEAVDAGTVKLVGTSEKQIIEHTRRLLYDKEEFEKMSAAHNPYGDGKASERIIQKMLKLI
jgi:UDP-N-acetylglucosamine 2-epimerase (non-hydrolysing)